MKNRYLNKNKENSQIEDEFLLSFSDDQNESYEYLQAVFTGFVWIFMFLISLFAIFLLFETPYYKYYNQKEPFLLKEIPDNDLSITPNNEEDISDLLNNNQDKVQNSVDNLGRSTELETTNDGTQSEHLLKKEAKINNNMGLDSNLIANQLQKDLKTIKSKNASNSSMTKFLKNKVKDAPQSPVKVEKGISPYPLNASQDLSSLIQKNSTTSKLQKGKKEPMQSNFVWVVNLYSLKNKTSLQTMLSTAEKKYPLLFKNTNVYFIEYAISNQMNYRISIAPKISNNPFGSFKTNDKAKQYCLKLKKQGVDCFISSIAYNSLKKYKVR